MSKADKIKASFLLGACGDALGAPLEGIRTLQGIIDAHGPEGLKDIIEFKNVYETGVDYPAGRVTDDTTMAMTTAAALLKTLEKVGLEDNSFIDVLRKDLWQGYINWAAYQRSSDGLKDKADEAGWPDSVKAFWFVCGAGRGTIAALLQNAPGAVDKPLDYDCMVDGRRAVGPNPGCGGMMRVVPLAFIAASPARIFEISCESAAVTHGDPAAFVATGAVGLMIHFAAQDKSIENILQETRAVLESYRANPHYARGVDECVAAIDHAISQSRKMGADMQTIEDLPRDLGHGNPFLAVPVLAQTVYALHAAAGNEDKMDQATVRDVVALSANHSGDSDSVAAIVGNIMGARFGSATIPQDWLAILTQKHQIEAMAVDVYAVIGPSALKPKPSKNPRP